MKLTKFAHVVVLGLIAVVAVTGCKKRPTSLTVLPGQKAANVGDADTANPLGMDSDANKVGSEGVPLPDADKFANYSRNTEIFKAYTVYFDYDSSVVKAGEKSKVAHVADYLKSQAAEALSIEGHCDERGTEEYNRSLGERRALALREEMVRLGVDAGRIQTTSFGEDRPVATGHDDSAWKQNRRGEFILLTPPAAP